MDRPRGFRGPAGLLAYPESDETADVLAMLLEGETSGRALDEVLAEFGRSRSTYYEKLQRFREEGLEGLLPRRPGPRAPWKLTLDAAARVVRLRLASPDRSASSIAEALSHEGLELGVRTVERVLSQFGLTHLNDARSESDGT